MTLPILCCRNCSTELTRSVLLVLYDFHPLPSGEPSHGTERTARYTCPNGCGYSVCRRENYCALCHKWHGAPLDLHWEG